MLHHLAWMADHHPFLMFCELMLIGCALRVLLLSITRGYRLAMVRAHGWPPSHLDADGDWKPEPDEDED